MPRSLLQGGTLFVAEAERVLQALPQASVLVFHLMTGKELQRQQHCCVFAKVSQEQLTFSNRALAGQLCSLRSP